MGVGLSVVVCTRNRCSNLRRALDSLGAMRASAPWELVLVNNGSTDGTGEMLRGFHHSEAIVSVVYEPTPGLGRARNAGWRAATGAIIAFTDDDCYPTASFVDDWVNVFEKNGVGFGGGRILLYDPADLELTTQRLQVRVDLPAGRFVPTGLILGANFAFRRLALEEIGGFDDGFGAGTPYACEDVDALARAAYSGWAGVYDPRPLVYHHHGRRTRRDARRLTRSYDVGRGAYFAKTCLNPKLRRQCLEYWWQRVRSQRLVTTVREVRGSFSYLLQRLFV